VELAAEQAGRSRIPAMPCPALAATASAAAPSSVISRHIASSVYVTRTRLAVV
jgi:hypothetical protein